MNKAKDGASWSASASPEHRTNMARMRVGACHVDPELDRISGPTGESSLEPKAMAVLVHLARHPGEVVSAGELIDVVWRGRPMGDNPVYRCITQLRRALGDDSRAPTYIATVPTKGYRLIASVEIVDAGQPPSAPDSPQDDIEPRPVRPVVRGPLQARRSGTAAPLTLLVLLAGLAGLLWYLIPGAAPVSELSGRPTLAVLPLRTAANDEAGILLAQSITDLVRNRLAALKHLTVVASSSTAGLTDSRAGTRFAGAKLHARYLLQGGVDRVGGRVRVDVQLLEAPSGRQVWSSTFDSPLPDVATLRDDIFRQVLAELHIPVESEAGNVPGSARISLDAYRLYVRGQQLLVNANAAYAGQAVETFRRATMLDPEFARGYLGFGQALAWQSHLGGPQESELRDKAMNAFDRALQLNPGLGEAWVGEAGLTRDPHKAQALYRKGLALAPNDGAGYAHYADFLFDTSRAGEAIETIDHAIQIDPLMPELYLKQAFYVMVVRSDVTEHDRLVRKALEINPRLPSAFFQLAYSRWEYSGEFADGARLIERAIALDPQALKPRMLARDIYLDLGDPAAAADVLGKAPPPAASMELAQYEGDSMRSAALLKGIKAEDWPDKGPQASKAQAIRDAAIATGDFGPALRRLRAVQAFHEGRPPMWYRGFAAVYAHTLLLAGEVERGRQLASSTLALLDTHSVGRPEHWFSRERAAAFAVLGKDDRVLDALAYSVKNGQFYRWWYLAGRDPLYQQIRRDPRFQALNRQAMAHRNRQRALLEEMRRAEEVPSRTPARGEVKGTKAMAWP